MKKTILVMILAAITLSTFATDDKKQITLRIMAANAADDKAYVNFDLGYTTAFDSLEDAAKVQGTSQGIPVIYTLTSNGVSCATNNYGEFNTDEVIPVGVNVDSDGEYTFNIEGVVNFRPTSLIMLEDKSYGSFVVLNSNTYTTTINATDTETGRFYLHVKKPAQYAYMNANCSNTGGKIDIAYSPDVVWTSVNLLDSTGALLQTLNNVSNTFVFNGLAGGKYSIQFDYGTQFTATEVVYLNSEAVTVSINNTVTTVAVNQEMQFFATTVNASDFQWQISDGTIIEGVVNTYYTFAQKGDYTVVFNATNDYGCQSSDTAVFSVQEPTGITKATKDEINIFAYSNRVTVNIHQLPVNEGVIRIFNLIGTEIYTRPISASVTEISLDVPTSYYIVSVENNMMKRTQKVFVSAK